MSRLIDADVLVETLADQIKANESDTSASGMLAKEVLKGFIGLVNGQPTASDWDRYSTALWREAYERSKRDGNSTVQPSGWLETHVEEIMQAGYEGREVEFRLNGRAFRIREVPQ